MFSIRIRLFALLVTLLVPMGFFVWLLMEEVNKQIDFAQKERMGIELQQPLVGLLAKVNGADAKKVSERYGKIGAEIGFSDQPIPAEIQASLGLSAGAKWQDLHGALQAQAEKVMAAGELPSAEDAARMTALTRAMIARSTDGSNLALDPDLDSYYLMDALSFGLPSALDNLSAASAQLARFHAQGEVLSGQQLVDLGATENKIQADLARITGSLATALSEDKNYYGESASFASVVPKIEQYKTRTTAALEIVGAFKRGEVSEVTSERIVAGFAAASQTASELAAALSPEMEKLLEIRIGSFDAHKQNLMLEGLAVLVVSLVLFAVISISITRPINRLCGVMGDIAAGQIDAIVPYQSSRSEMGKISRAVVVFQKNAQTLRDMARDFQSSIQHVVDVVASAATELDSASGSLKSQAGESHERIKELSGGIHDVSKNMGVLSASGAQLSSAINEIGEQIQRSLDSTGEAVSQAQQARDLAGALADSATRVTDIVGMINSITSRINLLALNATIESARAGEAGKGFAVVANEVKTLASQTGSATAQISELLTTIRDQSGTAVESVARILSAIDSINQVTSSISSAVEEQGAATRDISNYIQNINAALDHITRNAENLTNMAAGSSATAAQTMMASKDLSKQSETLRGDVGGFLRRLVGEAA